MSGRPGLFAELKRRNVFRVAIFYVVTAWLVIEVAETVLPIFDVPEGVLRGLVVLLVIGLVPALGLSWIYELTPEGIKRDAGASPEQAATTSHKLNWATLLVAVAAIGLVVYDRMTPEAPAVPVPAQAVADSSEEESASEAGPTFAEAGDASIAVLPFADLSPAGDQEYFSDGMAEEILNALVKVDGLHVASRTSAFGFKGQESLGMRRIAEQLGVRHVLEGSVRKAGDNLRITAQLIDAQSDRHLWSDTFDRPLTAENVFSIQDEIATAIVAALMDSLGMREAAKPILGAPTANFDAYDLYLQARALFLARTRLDEADQLLAQALEQDPGFAKAWELRAGVNAIIYEYGYSERPKDERTRLATDYAERALALDPASAGALATLAFIRTNAVIDGRARHDWAEIIRDLERAAELDPGNASTLNWLGLSLGYVGRLEDAHAMFKRCSVLDPYFGPCAENLYDILMSLDRPEESMQAFIEALDRGAVTGGLYINFTLLAHFEEKLAFMLAANHPSWLAGWRRHGELYEAYRDPASADPEFLQELREFVEREKNLESGYLKDLLIPLGAYDLTPFPILVWGERYAGYRASPQFNQFIRQTGTFDYWRDHGFPPQCRPLGEDGFECD
jgi:TolB-like protein